MNQNPNVIVLSHATYGASAAATYKFLTKNYKPPREPRYLDTDVVKNQNGKFKYVYDNGPGFKQWEPFSIACEGGPVATITGAVAATQLARLREMWNHPGLLSMQTPDGTYSVHWSQNSLEENFRIFPRNVNDVIETEVVVQFEEG